jgi:hypothetical protein
VRRGRGLGRCLVLAGRELGPNDQPVYAQVSPGNVASFRAVLGAGLSPVASEVLLFAQGDQPGETRLIGLCKRTVTTKRTAAQMDRSVRWLRRWV